MADLFLLGATELAFGVKATNDLPSPPALREYHATTGVYTFAEPVQLIRPVIHTDGSVTFELQSEKPTSPPPTRHTEL